MERRMVMKKKDTKEDKSERIRQQLGDSPRGRRRQEIMDMDMDEIDEEIKKTEKAIEDNLQKRAERVGIAVAAGCGTPPGKKAKLTGSKLPWMLMILGVAGIGSKPVKTFTVYDCPNRSNIVESYSLLEPDAFTASEGNGEVETVVYVEIMLMEQDRTIPIFRCQVVETIVSQYCEHWSYGG